MPNIYNAGQLAGMITQLAANDIADLGTTPNTFIYQYMNIVMMKLARIAFLVTYSDPLPISANGQYIFKKGSIAITDLFEPQVVLDANETAIQKRTSYESLTGWWRDSQNQEIHFRGVAAGNYTLKYLKYPARVTLDTDLIEFPPSGYDALIKEVLSLIKYSKNSYAGAEFMDGKAKAAMGEAAQGSMSGRGTSSSGQPVGPNDTLIARGGG